MNRARVASYAALSLIVVAVVVILSSGSNNGYKVRAEFADVDGLRQGSTVKVDGVGAGTVSSLTVTNHSTAMATLTLDKGVGPIGQGASVEIRPTDLLGERYAQVTLGDVSHPLPSGSFIPMARTSAPVDLDDVIDAVNAPLRTRLRILINEAGIALAGRGADFNALLNDLPPNLGQAQQLLGQVAAQNASLEDMIHQGAQDSMVIDGKRLDMGHAITAADDALQTVVLKQAQLGQTLRSAPAALSELHTTLNEVGTASRAIQPAAVSLQQATGPLTRTLHELPSFANSARQTLITAKRVAPQVTKLGVQARAPLAALKPTAAQLQGITKSAQPILGELDQRAMRDLLWFVENWELATKDRDGIGHWVGADLVFDTSILQTAVDGFVNNTGLQSPTPARVTATGHRAVAPKVTLPTTAPASAPAGNPLPGVVKKTLGGLTSGVSTILKGATGNVSSTLGGLLKKATGGLSAGAGSSPSSGGPSSSNLGHLLNFLVGR